MQICACTAGIASSLVLTAPLVYRAASDTALATTATAASPDLHRCSCAPCQSSTCQAGSAGQGCCMHSHLPGASPSGCTGCWHPDLRLLLQLVSCHQVLLLAGCFKPSLVVTCIQLSIKCRPEYFAGVLEQ